MIQTDKNLKPFNTFGVDCIAKNYLAVKSLQDLREALLSDDFDTQARLILGGGSNVLFIKNFEGLVLHNFLKGISVEEESEDFAYVRASAGEEWHDLVKYCVEKEWGGIENLSLIPGSVGAAPLQNIGAYGVELKDSFVSLKAMNLETGKIETFNKEACGFAYRTSAFKEELKGKYFILSILLRLSKKPVFDISYGRVQQEINEKFEGTLSVQNISGAICNIRESKLPNPKTIGNCGSFFKNAFVKKSHFETLKALYTDIPSYPAPYEMVKIPSAWLIEQCGWKGKVVGETGTYKNHALVLVNHGHATGEEIYDLSVAIQKSVKDKFDIDLMREVNVVRN